MATSNLSSDKLHTALLALGDSPCWWVALSGGLDSTVLLHLLAQVRLSDPGLPPLRALHVNHRLHPDADQWQRSCEQLCQELGVPLRCEAVTVQARGQGLESAARESRHRVFHARLEAGEYLFTGHHKDDQVETFLLRLLRGAGVDGLGAMAPNRPIGRGVLHRPLLDVTRGQLASYAREHALRYIDDPSNSDTSLDRNFLRHDVIPLLAVRWPGYRDTVSRAAGHLREAAEQLRQLIPEVPRCRSVFGDPGLELEALLDLPDSLAARVLRDWLRQLGVAQAPDSVVLLEFLRQLRSGGSGSKARLNTGGVTLQRFHQAVYNLPENLGLAPPAEGELSPGQSCGHAATGSIHLVQAQGAGLELEAAEVLSVRWRGGGERCRPLGRARSRSLKKLLQEARVPPWWRDRIPLLYLGDELLAVGDLWLCESSRLKRDGPGWQVRWKRNTPMPQD